VVEAARGQLATLPEGSAAVPEPDGEALPFQVQQLISAAVSELQRIDPHAHTLPPGAAAPVLGGGVVSELLRRRFPGQAPQDPDERQIDTRR
jgi:hypothetical protein